MRAYLDPATDPPGAEVQCEPASSADSRGRTHRFALLPALAFEKRQAFRLLALAMGVLLFVHVVREFGPAELAKSIASLRWGLAAVIALAGLSHVVKTYAWRVALLGESRQVSFARTLALRLGGEALGQLGALGLVCGETMRVSLLSSTVPADRRIISVTLDRAFLVFTGVLVSVGGLIAALMVLPLTHKMTHYADLLVCGLVGFLAVTVTAVRRRWPILSGTAQALSRIPLFRGWLSHKSSRVNRIESELFDFCHIAPQAFWVSFALNVVCHGLAILEVYLILWLAGAHIRALTALAIEALTKLVLVVGVLNPGNIGTYEGGNMLIGKMLGFGGVTGLTLGLTRRVRLVFWTVVGGICLALLSKFKRPACET